MPAALAAFTSSVHRPGCAEVVAMPSGFAASAELKASFCAAMSPPLNEILQVTLSFAQAFVAPAFQSIQNASDGPPCERRKNTFLSAALAGDERSAIAS